MAGILCALFVPAVAVIALMSVFYIACRKYDEGVTVNPFLVLLVIACGIVLYEAAHGTLQAPAPIYQLMVECFAAFMARHAWRIVAFHWRDRLGWAVPPDMRGRA